MFALLTTRRFGPLFGVQFLTAYNDNLFRFGLLFFLTYHLMPDDPAAAAQLVTLAGGLFILPFALFSGLAGQVADAVCKARAVRWIKSAEIIIMAFGVLALWLESIPFMFAVLFAMGTQSTFFGPIKYAVLPQYLRDEEITGGTALVEAGTYTAILTGQLSGGIVTPELLMTGVLCVAVIGWLASMTLPPAPPVHAAHPVQANIFASSWSVLRGVARIPYLLWAVIGISWFWMVGIVFTSLFIPLVRGTLVGTEGVANLFVAGFSIGVALGSLLIGRLLGSKVSVRFVPVALVVMAVAAGDLYLAVGSYTPRGTGLAAAADFLSQAQGWRILADLVFFSMGGGAYIVPLYAVLMTRSDAAERARTIAGNNILNSVFMVVGALGASAMLSALDVAQVLLIAGVGNLLMIWPMLRLKRRLALADIRAPALEETAV